MRALAVLVGLASVVVLATSDAFVDGSGRAAVVGALGAVAWAIAALGAGGALLQWLEPELLEDDRGALHALAAGLLLWGLLSLPLAAVGGLGGPGFCVLAALLSAGWLLRPKVRLPALAPSVVVLGLLLLLPGLVDALAPPVDTDELYYHLALPKRMLETGGLLGGPLAPNGNRPLGLHLSFAALLWTGGEAAPRLFHLFLAGATLAAVAVVGRAHLGGPAGLLAAAVLAGSWSFLQGAGLAGNDLPVALVTCLALDAALRGRMRGLALMAGLALGLKYTAAGVLLGIFAVAAAPVRSRALAGLASLGLVAPWWLRNLAGGVHPLFPFAGWANDPRLSFQLLEKYGAGRSLADFALLPYNAVLTADVASFRFLGQVSPALLLLALPALVAGLRPGPARRVLVVSLVGGVAWAAGPHWLRYLVPALPALALALTAWTARSRAAAWATGLAIAVGLPANWGPLAERMADRLPAAFGTEERTAFLERSLPDWPAVAWLNRNLGDGDVAALLFNWSGYLVERPYVLGSVEDHVPVRAFLFQHGADSLAQLKAVGATHVLITRVGFIPKVYPFLSESDFKAAFSEPEAMLDRLLLHQATLVFQHDRTRVYRLE